MLVRAIRGPLVLILLGGLFAFDHAGVIGFDRTWPILIIVIGVFKLVERMLMPPAPPYPPVPPATPVMPTGGTR
jgi:hypothetical protein